MNYVSIEKNYLYAEGVFTAKQNEHLEKITELLSNTYEEISNNMNHLYVFFKADGSDVQRLWYKYCDDIDEQILDALKLGLKKSLQELSLTLNGDSKNDPQPIFGVNVTLTDDMVMLKPTMLELTSEVKEITKKIISTTAVLPRLTSQWDKYQKEAPDGFYDILSNDEEILKVVVTVMNGLSMITTELQKYLSYWEKYKSLWELDKENFIRKYAKQNRPLSQYDIDIQRYKDLQDEVQSEEQNSKLSFIMLDSNLLKISLVDHCLQWQTHLISLLNTIARKDLEGLHKKWEEDTITLTTKPLNLDELATAIKLLQSSRANANDTIASFDPIDEKYNTLKKFDLQVTDDEEAMLLSLRSKWQAFRITMTESDKMLNRSKQSMQQDVENALDNLVSDADDQRKVANEKLPL